MIYNLEYDTRGTTFSNNIFSFIHLNNYFNFHVCLSFLLHASVRACVRASVRVSEN